MEVQPYLFFEGHCDEALAFYKEKLGAEVLMLMRFKDSPMPPQPGCEPTDPNLVMHSSFRIGKTTINAADGLKKQTPKFEGFSLSLSADNDADAKKFFAALSESGKVIQPLIKTFFTSSFGMLVDKFGVHWMVLVPQPM